MRPGDIVEVRGKSQGLQVIVDSIGTKASVRKYPWLEWNPETMSGHFVTLPTRDQIPETLNEQLIVELYSK